MARKVASPRVVKNIVIEGADIAFRNFSGKEGRFNPKGQKNFCVFLDVETAETLSEDGWNIKWLDPREEGDEKKAYLQVSVSYDNFPPKIMLITGRGKSFLDSESVNVLDWAEIETVDLIIKPYNWEVNGKTGVKGYVKSMYVTIIEDALAAKYADDSGGEEKAIPWEADDDLPL